MTSQSAANAMPLDHLHQSTPPLTTLEAVMQSSKVALSRLEASALLEVSGDEAVTFLQGQFTNDIKQLTEQGQLNGYCTAKGRLLSILKTTRLESSIYLELPASLRAPIQKRLQMFVLRSKVTLTDASQKWTRIGLAGEKVITILDALGFTLPNHAMAYSQRAGGLCLRLHGDIPRVQLWLTPEQCAQHASVLESMCQPISNKVWEGFEILAGIPDIGPESQELFVPQMVNLDLLQGINFKKGCYTGQEIVARTHYLGKVKRRTFYASLATADGITSAPTAGDVILARDGQEAGHIVRIAPRSAQAYCLLVEVRLEVMHEHITWNGVTIQIEDHQPYEIPT